jgi:ABC-type sugar transport system substrate-binding protein
MDPSQRIKILCHDYTSVTDNYVKEGVVDAIICQDPVAHGYMAMKILSELVLNKKEPKKQIYLTNLDIRLRENLITNAQDWEI